MSTEADLHNLNIPASLREESIASTDSDLRSPISGHDHSGPFSGSSSPNKSQRPLMSTKKSLLGRRPKWIPTGISEGLEHVPANISAKDADLSGWLRKRGERSYNWKLRYFALKGTRLAYYHSEMDQEEKGLVDINSHRVVTIDDILFYGPSRWTFKLVPPAPGASRAVNFTPPRTHFFCAETKDQMRLWITAFMKATIGRDWTTPVITTFKAETISLKAAAQELKSRPPVLPSGQTKVVDSDAQSTLLPSPPGLDVGDLQRPGFDRCKSNNSGSSFRQAVSQAGASPRFNLVDSFEPNAT